MHSTRSITELSHRWSEGDEGALGELIELAYPRLRELAKRQLGSSVGDPTIDTTALVHETYLRFAGGEPGVWPSRGHFFAFCAKVMRHVLIDQARRRRAEKRGGTMVRVPLTPDVAAVEAQAVDLLQIEDLVTFLAKRNQRLAQVVECRFFGGLSIAETAEALGSSPRTIVREWDRARAYLLRALDADRSGEPPPGAVR